MPADQSAAVIHPTISQFFNASKAQDRLCVQQLVSVCISLVNRCSPFFVMFPCVILIHCSFFQDYVYVSDGW